MTQNDNISVLFRYRDLIDRTVERHQEIIAKKGYCFWGWWKRPTEGPRHEVWDHLEREIEAAPNGEVAIGLFDSGEKENPRRSVTRAWITNVKRPNTDESGRVPTVPLDQSEKELVPTYYRDSSFSRAWMTIVRFEAPFDFFEEYSLEFPPPLPGMGEDQLRWLKDKLIKDAHELRAMDTTIWRVRPKQEYDLTERILSSSLRLVEPVSRKPIRVESPKILHLSDVHFAHDGVRDRHCWGYPGGAESSPHFRHGLTSQDPEEFADDGLLSQDVLEVLHDGEEPFVGHVGYGVEEVAALVEQGVGPLLGGVGLEGAVVAAAL